MARQNVPEEAAKEIRTIMAALDGHDQDFTMPMYQAVIGRLADYFHNGKLSLLLWHLRRFRNEALIHDAKESGD